eukprot:314920-Chlamydomonas_euryale.AAC.2
MSRVTQTCNAKQDICMPALMDAWVRGWTHGAVGEGRDAGERGVHQAPTDIHAGRGVNLLLRRHDLLAYS